MKNSQHRILHYPLTAGKEPPSFSILDYLSAISSLCNNASCFTSLWNLGITWLGRTREENKMINSWDERGMERWVAASNANSIQFSSVAQLCLTLCNPMNHSTPGLPVHHQLPELTQTHIHQDSDAIQPSHPLLSPSPPAFNLSQHQSLFQWVSSSHQVAKLLEFQVQQQSFQWIFRTDFL